MPYEKNDLPAYPLSEDLWDRLARETRPIVVYGMGNGADKLFDRLGEYNILPANIFASDGFVRGHSFRGMRVMSFSEIKEMYSDFVILLSFASNREEVLSMLSDIDSKYEMYVPDMPVAGVEEYFDKAFYNAHYTEIRAAYNALFDEESRHAFAAVINYKLTGKMSYLEACYSTRDELYSAIPCDRIKTVIDVGAYNGDTLREAKSYFPNLRRAYALEPDPKTYKRLMKYVDIEDSFEIIPMNVGAWCDSGDGVFQSAGNRNSSINSSASFEHSTASVSLVTVDSLGASPDYIKYDVEGAEYEALVGSGKTIERCHPTLLVSLYHRSRDIFFLVNYLKSAYPEYKLTLRRLRCVPAWEIDLILTT